MAQLTSTLWAVAFDLLFGEPPASIHPTVHMGNFITRYKPRVPESPARRNPRTQTKTNSGAQAHTRIQTNARAFTRGAAITAGGLAGSALFGMLLNAFCDRSPLAWQSLFRGAALKPALSLRPLLAAARSIERALAAHNLAEARRLLAWHLVSRDTTTLTASEVAGAAIESIAENLSDSFVAPLFMYHIGGLPAAYAYRFANTADAMLGYRTPALEWLGKCAARTDDALNVFPARITALCIALAAPVAHGSTRRAFQIATRDSKRTTSPNAGWPMAAMAGALGCQLTKRGVYVLHAHGTEPTVHTLRRAQYIVLAAAAVALVCSSLIDD